MSRTRWVLAITMALILVGLLTWHVSRVRQMAACEESRGIWHGPTSRCLTPPAIILQRDLRRS